MVRACLLMLSAVLLACDSGTPPARRGISAPVVVPPQPVAEPPAAGKPVLASPAAEERHFGGAPTLAGAALPVEQVLSAPEPYLGKPVKCSGTVARVCQAAGCWLELQPTGGGEGLRVPMANHAFFIPKDAVGQLATIEGELKRNPLPEAQREHYAGEGMQAMGPLSLEATSVVLRK